MKLLDGPNFWKETWYDLLNGIIILKNKWVVMVHGCLTATSIQKSAKCWQIVYHPTETYITRPICNIFQCGKKEKHGG